MKVLLAVFLICGTCTSAADSSASASDVSSAVSKAEPSRGSGEFASARALIETQTSALENILGKTPKDEALKSLSRESRQLSEDFASTSSPPTETVLEDDDELTDQERLDILQELERLNSTEPEQLPQPEMFISHVRNYWRRQEEAQQKIRNEILDMILPRKKSRPPGPPRGPLPNSVPARIQRPPPPPPPRPDRRADRRPPPPGRRNPGPRERDQVIGHQPPPPGLFGGPPPPDHRNDVQSAQPSIPAPAPFLFKVPGEGVIQLPPPPTHASAPQDASNVFPPPFPVGKQPANHRPGLRPRPKGHHGNRRRPPPANQEAPPRRSPPNHEPPRRPHNGLRAPIGPRRPQERPPPDSDRRRRQEEEHRRRLEEEEHRRRLEDEERRRRFEGEEQRRRHQEDFRPPFPQRPPSFVEEQSRPRPDLVRPETRPDPGPGPGLGPVVPRRPPNFDFGPPDGGFKPSDIDFGSSNFRPFSPVNNDLSTTTRRECDFYAEDICLASSVYPGDAIRASISRDRPMVDAMFAEVQEQSADILVEGVSSKQEELYDYTHYFGAESRTQTERRGIESHSHRDFAQDGGYLCPSEVKYARPKRAKNSKGEWKFIVNMDRYTQTLRMEKCMRPGGSCSYVSHHYKSQCSQVSNYHRLLSWDKQRGLHMDIFKVPVACSCHIQGYAYVYPPLGGASIGGRAQSTIRETVENPPGDSGRTRRPFQTVVRPSREPETPPPPPVTTTTPAPTTSTTTEATTTTRRYRGISRLRPTRRRKVTFPPYRPRPKLDTVEKDNGDSPIQIPGLADPDDVTYFRGSFGDRLPTDTNEIRRRSDQQESGGSYQVPAILPPPPPTQSQPEERINYGYHPIIDFFGK
ncbi:uncharacterized protein LOC122371262 [Amphibalanus amphitrite]|uniref:uncharacterized protein LOC122371262 n=2 Tax=Amphibalanus amphitrite TaxID=1232801 RepID=UPI001C903488|nr:uncharacterized protein LOC122371262 [Amphibalanus amphitrite]XP_043203372.1 uncharacterized protein LOC122371262 [Amphibalanus amphitrite]